MNTLSWFGLGLILLAVVVIRRAAPNADWGFLTAGELLLMLGAAAQGAAIAMWLLKRNV